VAPPQQHPGGKGINVAKALHAFGIPAIATGFLGGHRGRWIAESLREAGLDARFVELAAETRVNVKVTEASGRLTELNAPAPPIAAAEWSALESHLAQVLEGAGWLALCGNLPSDGPVDWYRRQIERARGLGVRTVLDASGAAFREGIQAKPDVIKPNLRELSELVGRPLSSAAEVAKAAAELQRDGIGWVVVSMGADGLIGIGDEGCWQVRVPNVPVVSSVGAGDTVVAGLLYGIHHGWSFPETVRFAAAAGTAAVTQRGNQRPDLADVQRVVPSVQVERMEVSI
jgi:1-phosphofructokinase